MLIPRGRELGTCDQARVPRLVSPLGHSTWSWQHLSSLQPPDIMPLLKYGAFKRTQDEECLDDKKKIKLDMSEGVHDGNDETVEVLSDDDEASFNEGDESSINSKIGSNTNVGKKEFPIKPATEFHPKREDNSLSKVAQHKSLKEDLKEAIHKEAIAGDKLGQFIKKLKKEIQEKCAVSEMKMIHVLKQKDLEIRDLNFKLETQLIEKEDLGTKCKNLMETTSNMIGSLRRDNGELETQVLQLEKEKDLKVQQIEREKEVAAKTVESLEMSMKQSMKTLTEKEESLNAKTEELVSLKNVLMKSKHMLDEKENTVKAQAKELDSLKDDLFVFKSKGELMEHKNSQMVAENKNLIARLANMEKEASEKTATHEAELKLLHDQNKEMQSKQDELKEVNQTLEGKQKDLEDKIKELRENDAVKSSELSCEMIEKIEAINEADEKIKQMEEAKSSLESRNVELKTEIQKISEKVTKIEREKEVLREEKELAIKEQEVAVARKDLEKQLVEKEKEEINAKIKSVMHDYDSLQIVVKSLKNEVEERRLDMSQEKDCRKCNDDNDVKKIDKRHIEKEILRIQKEFKEKEERRKEDWGKAKLKYKEKIKSREDKINEKEDKIKTLKDKLEKKDKKIQECEQKIGAGEKDMKDKEGKISTLEEEIKDKNMQITEWEKKIKFKISEESTKKTVSSRDPRLKDDSRVVPMELDCDAEKLLKETKDAPKTANSPSTVHKKIKNWKRSNLKQSEYSRHSPPAFPANSSYSHNPNPNVFRPHPSVNYPYHGQQAPYNPFNQRYNQYQRRQSPPYNNSFNYGYNY